jgi:hypothetical protein
MADIIKYYREIKVPAIVAITDVSAYVYAREDADALVKEHNGVIADMPRLIAELGNAKARTAIRKRYADVNSAEYQGQTEEGRVYAVGHSLGPLTTTERIKQGIKNIHMYGFLSLNATEWKTFMNNPEMVPLDDIKKGFSSSQPYAIFANLDKDNVVINDSGLLDYDHFMKDDRLLMVAGSLESRENIANILFKEEKRRIVGSYHRIKEGTFNNSGRPVFLDSSYCGFDSKDGSGYYERGRFVVVAPEAHVRAGYSNHKEFLEAKVKESMDARKPIQVNGGVYAFIPDVCLSKR